MQLLLAKLPIMETEGAAVHTVGDWDLFSVLDPPTVAKETMVPFIMQSSDLLKALPRAPWASQYVDSDEAVLKSDMFL